VNGKKIMRSLEEIKEYFANDLYATQATGIEIVEAEPGHAKVQLKLEDKHKNAADNVMGAVYFTMVDFASAIANNNDISEGVAVTTNSQMNILSAAKGKMLFAEANVIKNGRRVSFTDIQVTDDTGRHVVSATCTAFRTRIK